MTEREALHNRTDNRNGKRGENLITAAASARQLTEYLLAVVAAAVCVVVPLYAKDGYHQIGNAKFEAYRRIMTGGFGVLLIAGAAYGLCRIAIWLLSGDRRPMGKLRFSLTDQFVLAYLVLTGLSVVSGGFYEDALWGAPGWNMGLFSQISFVLLYLFLSRFGRYYKGVLVVLCAVAAVVFAIGILHRLMIDPIGFYYGLTNEQKAQFLSTLGQATWYASFLAVTLPVGIGVFLYAENIKWRAAGGVYMMLGFCTLVTQNSDSAYFALAGAMLLFFMISCERPAALCRFTAALTLFFSAGKLMYWLTGIQPNPDLEPDFVTELMWTSGFTWGLLVLSAGLTVIFYIASTKPSGGKRLFRGAVSGSGQYSGTVIRRLRWGIMGAVTGLIVLIVLVICLQARGMLPAGLSDRVSTISYLNWNREWGNGRGRIWSFTCRMLSEESMGHRIFGVGPDCFNSYAKAYHRDEVKLLWGEKLLTNAHNEWFTMLINGGLVGAAAYMGIYVTAVGRFLRGRRRNYLLTGIAAACVSYMCYNFFCYQQVLCTPFIFLLMGVGEYILRHIEDKEDKDDKANLTAEG